MATIVFLGGGVVAYLVVVFLLSRLFIPHLGRLVPAHTLPAVLEEKIRELNAYNLSDEAFVRALLDMLKGRFRSKRAKMFLYPSRFFEHRMEKIWETGGTQPCTIWNYFFVTMLVRSGRFTQQDIRARHTFVNGCIHQYLEVTMKDGSTLDIDPWGYGIGKVKVGEHASGFL